MNMWIIIYELPDGISAMPLLSDESPSVAETTLLLKEYEGSESGKATVSTIVGPITKIPRRDTVDVDGF